MSTTATRIARQPPTWWGIGRPSSAASRFSTASVGHPLAGGVGGRADVRRDDQVRRAEQRIVGRQRLGVGDVERGAGDRARRRSAQRSARWSTIGPRAVLIRIAVGFIRASAAASIRWWVSGVSGQCSETKSDSASSRCSVGAAAAAGVRAPASRSPRRAGPPPGRSGPAR